jgi:UDP-glucose 4-epimerase
MQIASGRFLITGGASLIGSHTTEVLLAAGAKEVVLFDNLSFGTPEEQIAPLLATGRVRLVRGDVLDAQGLLAASVGVDGIFALAGFMSSGIGANPSLALNVNVNGVLNVLEACRVNRVKRLVFASSSAVYGYGAIGGAIGETEPYRAAGVPAPPALYGASKIIGEQLCKLYREQHGLNFVILRYSTVYGERQHYRSTNALYIIQAYDRLAEGKSPILYGDGSETKDFVYVGDVARANRIAMESDIVGEAFNISGGKPLTVKFLAETIARIAGLDIAPEYRAAPTGGFRIATDAPFYYDRSKAENMLGWIPEVGIEEGIRRLIVWRKQNPPPSQPGTTA